MKRILPLILLTFLLTNSCLAQKKQDGKIVAKYLINGYFFQEKPTLPESVTAGGMDSVFVLTDKDGNQLEAYRYTVELPDSVVRRSIPKKKVVNARFFALEEMSQRRDAEDARMDEGSGDRDVLPKVGRTFPLFNEKDANGRPWEYKDIEGRVTVFYLWHTGSVPSLSEMGELSLWKQMYPDVLFLSVTWHDVATVRRIEQQYHFTWTHLCNARQMMTWVDQGVGGTGTARVYPLTIVVDRQGIVRRIVSGTGLEKRRETQDCILRYR